LNILNSKISSYMKYVDTAAPPSASFLTDNLRKVKPLIFWSNKSAIFETALRATEKNHNETNITINRFKAVSLRLANKTDWKMKRSCFAQAFRALSTNNNDWWMLKKNQRLYSVKFVGEYSSDAGGPYRVSIHDFCEELQSKLLPLFIPCPNQVSNIGLNREKWIPNPTATSSLYLQMYEFLGKLMGAAMRSGNLLDLDLPSIVWKGLCSQTIEPDDVLAIDILSFKILEQLKSLTAGGNIDKEMFSELVDYKFEISGSDGQTYPLIPNGKNITVNWESKDRFIEAYEKFRLNEFKAQADAMRRGLEAVIPAGVLSLLTWQELEVLVCGRPSIDVDLWEKNTVYEGCYKDDAHVKLFWTMVRTRLNPVEQSLLLKFCWGRSRLPLRSADFERPFKIASHSQANTVGEEKAQTYLPITHTCFFQLDLPKYRTMEVMYNKMLFSITHCTAVDGDSGYNAGDISMNPDDD